MKCAEVSQLLLPCAKSLRLSAYLALAGIAIVAMSARVVCAQAREAALGVGHELVGLADLTDGAELLHVNGVQFHYSMAVTGDSVAEVLDRFEHFCETKPGIFGQLEDESAGLQGKQPVHKLLRNGVIRNQTGAQGMVVCFMGCPITGLHEFIKVLARFSKTRDLTDFGRLRYSYVERKTDGRSRVVTVWADTGLNLRRMFPVEGDAEGTDSSAIPRPPLSRRLLSADAATVSARFRMYQSRMPREQVRSYYSQWMKEHAWQLAASADGNWTASYLRQDGYQVIVAVISEGGETYATLTETSSASGQVRVTNNPLAGLDASRSAQLY